MEAVETNLSNKDQHLAALDHRNKIHSAKLKILQKELQCVQLENDVLLECVKNNKSQRNLGMPGQYQMPKSEQARYNSEESTGHEDKARKTPNMLPANQFAFPHSKEQNINDTQTNRNIQAFTKQPLSPQKNLDIPGNISAKMNNDQQKTEHNQIKSVDLEEIQKQRRRQIYSIYDSTAIKPQSWDKQPTQNKLPWLDVLHPYPGGFVLMRFDDNGYDSVNVALKSQQSICRNAGGYLLGIARKQRIFVYENAPTKQQNWNISRTQPYTDVVTTENAVAVFWFSRKEAAEAFFDNCHHNRFREPCFPTPNGYEALYVPLNCPPPMTPYNTLFFIEFLNAHNQYSEQNLTQFEGEVRGDMLTEVPGCLPMVVSSSSTGRVVFKPGALVSPYSKLFISRFESQRDVNKIWQLGIIQRLRKKWNLTGDVNVFSFTIDAAF